MLQRDSDFRAEFVKDSLLKPVGGQKHIEASAILRGGPFKRSCGYCHKSLIMTVLV